MGLDIASYDHFTVVKGEHNCPFLEDFSCFPVYHIPEFKDSERGLPTAPDAHINVKDADCYAWRAGSYSYYGTFRELLAATVGVNLGAVWAQPQYYRNVPFYELLNFSDCDGMIGPDAAKDLAEDFQTHRDAFIKTCGGDEHMVEKYDRFTKGLLHAAEGGVLIFG